MAIPRNLANIAPHVNASSTELVVNDAGANLDFRVEGDTNANLFFVDASADAIGISTSSPDSASKLTIASSTGPAVNFKHPNNNANAYISNFFDSDGNSFWIGSNLYIDSGANLVRGDTGKPSVGLNLAGRDGDGFMRFYTGTGTATERARITSGGFFKASNSGSYVGATGAYHEFRSDQQSTNTLVLDETNSNFDNNGAGMLWLDCQRSASSSYTFSGFTSGNDGDREFQFRGDGNAFADGTWSNNGADYAEFFESANGQALTLGATVVLDGNKVREATEQDPASAVIGVVRPKEPSKASMVIGNTAWNKWANKYLTDDFDRYIMEDHDVVEWTDEEGKQHSYESHNIPEGITVPADATIKTHDDKGNKFQHYKLNPAWDKNAEYVNRENRPEWNIIGLVGQVKVLKGQPTNDRWIKMRDVSATVEEWFIR
jgi:hypothetical protein